MPTFRPAMPHGPLSEVLPDVFVVQGAFRMGPAVRLARTMTVLRHGDELTLINGMRLTEDGEKELAKLGRVKNLLRIGFFHGSDDPYLVERYAPSFWSVKRVDAHNVDAAKRSDIVDGGALPLDAKAFVFQGGTYDEAAIHVDVDGGLLVTCDAVQNWTSTEHCSVVGGIMARAMGFFEPAKIGPPWLKQMGGAKLRGEFERLVALPFRHLAGGHGSALIGSAKDALSTSVTKTFG